MIRRSMRLILLLELDETDFLTIAQVAASLNMTTEEFIIKAIREKITQSMPMVIEQRQRQQGKSEERGKK